MRFLYFSATFALILTALSSARAQAQAPEFITITVLGQVAQPGNQQVRPGITVAEAVARAGGANETGDMAKVFVIHRRATAPITVNLTATPDSGSSAAASRTVLEDGSLVMVREKEHYVQVIGAVNRPGVYPFPASGSLTVAQALALAGGIWASISIDKIIVDTPYTSRWGKVSSMTKTVNTIVPISEIDTTVLNNKARLWVISKRKQNP